MKPHGPEEAFGACLLAAAMAPGRPSSASLAALCVEAFHLGVDALAFSQMDRDACGRQLARVAMLAAALPDLARRTAAACGRIAATFEEDDAAVLADLRALLGIEDREGDGSLEGIVCLLPEGLLEGYRFGELAVHLPGEELAPFVGATVGEPDLRSALVRGLRGTCSLSLVERDRILAARIGRHQVLELLRIFAEEQGKFLQLDPSHARKLLELELSSAMDWLHLLDVARHAIGDVGAGGVPP